MAGKKRVRTLLDLTTPEPSDSDFEYQAPGGFERRWPNIQPLHQGGGSLQDIGPQTYAPTNMDQSLPPAGMSFPNVGLQYSRPFMGGELNMQVMRPPLDQPWRDESGRRGWGGMLNWRREF